MKHYIIALAAAFAIAGFTDCQTTTDSAGKKHSELTPKARQVLENAGRVIGPAVAESLFQVAGQYVSGQNVTAPYIGFTVSSDLWQNVGNINSAQSVQSLVMQSAQGQASELANEAASAFEKSPSSNRASLNAIASIISTAAGAPPPPQTVR